MTEVTRRAVLGSVVGLGVTTLATTLPEAIKSATLQAEVEVLDAGLHRRGDPDVDELTVRLENQRPADGESIVAVPSIWGVSRETQVAWRPERGEGDWTEIPPGESRTMHLAPPRPSKRVRLLPDRRAMVRVFDRGTEQRREAVFVPEEVADWEVDDE